MNFTATGEYGGEPVEVWWDDKEGFGGDCFAVAAISDLVAERKSIPWHPEMGNVTASDENVVGAVAAVYGALDKVVGLEGVDLTEVAKGAGWASL